MSHAARGSANHQEAGPTLTELIDRWLFVFMALLLIVVTLTGFIPDSITKIGNVDTGKRPPFPLVLHIHALITGAWMLLLLAQSALVATGRTASHRSLGRLAMVLGPLLIVNGIFLAHVIYRQYLGMAQTMPAEDAQRLMAGQANATLLRIKHGLLFALFVIWALKLRLHDPATHKRLMILAPLSLMAVAFSRMTWLPTTMPTSPMALQFYVLLLAAPMVGWDLYRTGKVQRAYLIWLAAYLPTSLVVELLWNSPWWHGVVPGLMGVG